MYEMFNDIFKSLNSTEAAVKNLRRFMRRQKNFNSDMAYFALFSTVYLATLEYDSYKQRKRITKLEKEIAEMKNPEGE